ncbi:arylamine N-acetyltransferase family protein [Priestia megaterium]|uniref:arylamine N-acetyltransferase family protein n=1 Tax=Priestia megaterium TaxID=1404 RepID=UPI003D087E62
MSPLKDSFYSRLNIEPKKIVKFEDLPSILSSFARSVPFENIDVVYKDYKEISKENLHKKLLNNYRGGLCYEINPILYYFLKDCGFNVHLVSATIYDHSSGSWALDDTHVAIILTYNHMTYLIDSGFASFLPLSPVPLTGEVVQSKVRDYRVRKLLTEKGSYVFEMKEKDTLKNNEWKLGYAFKLNEISETELNEMQETIVENKKSPFNKAPLAVKLVENGHITLTKEKFTQIKNGQKTQEVINEDQYIRILNEQFNISVKL